MDTPGTLPPKAQSSAKILVVDDSFDILHLLTEMLGMAGYQVQPADSGELALAYVAANPPDLILLDINMKGINGLEVCRKIKSREATRHIPVILISGFAGVTDWVKGLQAGAADYINKPFKGEELLSRVGTHLALHQANLTLAQQAEVLRQTNDQLQAEVVKRQQVENDLRQSLAVAEEARKELNNTLNALQASQDERDRLQAQLSQAQKMEAIGVLAGGIAHDFNNILGVIIGYAGMAREDAPAGSRYASDLERVLTSAHRAKDLVKQILAFSRQSAVERVPIKLQSLIKESLKMLRASIPSTITIRSNIAAETGAVLADPTQVHQVIMNLCTNAFHAMEEKGGLLTIGLQPVSIAHPPASDGQLVGDGEYVELTVSDTGIGIGPDVIDKIFDPYFTTKGVGKGTGMGLAITHGIITSYDGAITVDSTLGQGTTFHVYFPMNQEEVKAPAEMAEAPMGSERILFVDDEELLSEMGGDLLERLGYTVTICNRSIEALELFMKDPSQFDLVITDQTMPGLTGTDLSRHLLEIRPDLPIILCTGFSNLVSEESAKAIGIREFALKPITKASIGQLIRKALISKP